MTEKFCPNIHSCRMVVTKLVIPDDKAREASMDSWCRKDESVWSTCTRYSTKKHLGFCPDFVTPDTRLSIDEIIDKFEENQD